MVNKQLQIILRTDYLSSNRIVSVLPRRVWSKLGHGNLLKAVEKSYKISESCQKGTKCTFSTGMNVEPYQTWRGKGGVRGMVRIKVLILTKRILFLFLKQDLCIIHLSCHIHYVFVFETGFVYIVSWLSFSLLIQDLCTSWLSCLFLFLLWLGSLRVKYFASLSLK